jgi:hypothetical protein
VTAQSEEETHGFSFRQEDQNVANAKTKYTCNYQNWSRFASASPVRGEHKVNQLTAHTTYLLLRKLLHFFWKDSETCLLRSAASRMRRTEQSFRTPSRNMYCLYCRNNCPTGSMLVLYSPEQRGIDCGHTPRCELLKTVNNWQTHVMC